MPSCFCFVCFIAPMRCTETLIYHVFTNIGRDGLLFSPTTNIVDSVVGHAKLFLFFSGLCGAPRARTPARSLPRAPSHQLPPPQSLRRAPSPAPPLRTRTRTRTRRHAAHRAHAHPHLPPPLPPISMLTSRLGPCRVVFPSFSLCAPMRRNDTLIHHVVINIEIGG